MMTDLLNWPEALADSVIRVHVSIPGEPISKQRPRFNRNKNGTVYTPKHTKEAEAAIQWAIKAAHREIVEDSHDAFGVRLVFHCKGYQRRDIDNMCKLILDACNGFIWRDDQQVQELISRVIRYADEPKTEIVIYTLGSAAARLGTCALCKKPYKTFASWQKRRRYCSNLCKRMAVRAGRGADCKNCGKSINRDPAVSLTANIHFCSAECHYKYKTDELSCELCAKKFRRPKSLNRRGRKFCSIECQAAFFRPIRLKRAEGICSKCGGPTSKKTYTTCRVCSIRSGKFRSSGQSVGWNSKRITCLEAAS